jgi:carbon starvation protein
MNSLVVAAISFLGFILAYRFYAEFVSKRLFNLNPKNITPSHEFEDGVDYVPTRRSILFGHHFASIAGTGPIVGPAIAVIWGWLPAMIWIVVGSIFMGAVHDFAALMVSARNQGKSLAEVSKGVINPRVRILFFLTIFFCLLIVVAIFAMIIAQIFDLYTQTIIPVFLQIPLAMFLGSRFYKGGKLRPGAHIALWSLFALLVMYLSICIGIIYPISIPSGLVLSPLTMWVVILLTYCYAASTLPVWSLLQPRDYINSHQLMAALALLILGLVVAHPEISALMVDRAPAGAPMMIPFFFITIACGAISGFHSLVASGTTAKQMDLETDAKAIGYGGMIMEGVLAITVLLACGAGLSQADFTAHYASWAEGLPQNLEAFVDGGGTFLESYGIPTAFATGILGVMVASFAGTTLDTATRLQRYVITELDQDYNVKPLATKHGATLLAVGGAAALAFAQGGGKGGLILWPLFGTTNQLLAGLALLVITVYLYKRGRSIIYTLIPMIFMIIMTISALLLNLQDYLLTSKWHLLVIGGIVTTLAIWAIVEGIGVSLKIRRIGGR